jgi:hypothetical protein
MTEKDQEALEQWWRSRGAMTFWGRGGAMSDDVEKLIERLDDEVNTWGKGSTYYGPLYREAATTLRSLLAELREEKDRRSCWEKSAIGTGQEIVKMRARAEKAEAEIRQLRMRLDWYCKEYSRHVVAPALKGEPYDIYQQGREDGRQESQQEVRHGTAQQETQTR